MDDAPLVLAAQSGEGAAFAAVYDSYADRVYDFCYSTLRDEAAAAEVTTGTFLIAFEHMDQLRQPDRLMPWLYSIAHRGALRWAEPSSGRVDATSELTLAVAANAVPAAAMGKQPSWAELSDFVWQAAEGLAPRDRALLDLYLRQGLAGSDLADAVGTTAPDLGVTLDRLQAQVERALGALLVARTNARNCPSLAGILGGWDGRLTPELRGSVTRHVDDCELCNTRRRIALNPLALLSAVPPVPAPARLREAVLAPSEGASATHAGDGWSFEADGFPHRDGDRRVELPATGPTAAVALGIYEPPASYALSDSPAPNDRSRPPLPLPPGTAPTTVSGAAGASPARVPPPAYRRQLPFGHASGSPQSPRSGLVIGILAGLIILVGGVTAFLASGKNHTRVASPGVSAPPTSVIAPGTTASPVPATTTGTSTTVGQGHFVPGATTVDFGATQTQQSLTLTNNGTAPIGFTASPSGSLLTVVPASGTLAAGETTSLTISFDRGHAQPGIWSGAVDLTSGPVATAVTVTAEVGAPPSISDVRLSPLVIVTDKKANCPFRNGTTPDTAMVTATVTANVSLAGVVLKWQAGRSGTRDMTGTGATVTGTLGPFPGPGPVTWWIVATDANGAVGTSPQQNLTVRPCP